MQFDKTYKLLLENIGVPEISPYKPCPKCGSPNVWNGPKEGYAEGHRFRGSVKCWDCDEQWSGFNWKKKQNELPKTVL